MYAYKTIHQLCFQLYSIMNLMWAIFHSGSFCLMETSDPKISQQNSERSVQSVGSVKHSNYHSYFFLQILKDHKKEQSTI